MPYFVGGPAVGAPGEVHDTQLNPLLAENITNEGKTYIYLKGVAACITGSWVAYDENATTVGLDTDVAASIISPVAVASAAIVAAKFGWFGVDGVFSGGTLAGILDNAKVFASATIFMLDDTSIAGSQIVPAVARSTDTAGLTLIEIHHPFCGINVA